MSLGSLRNQSQRPLKLRLRFPLPNVHPNPIRDKVKLSRRALPLQAEVQIPTRLQMASIKAEAASKVLAQLVVAAPLLVDDQERIFRLAFSF